MLQLIVTILVLCASAGSVSANDSAYTRHDWEQCPEVGDGSQGVVERRCVGYMGIAVKWVAGDDASSVDFDANPLDEVVNTGGFFEVGSTIEWRMSGLGRRSFAAIVRYAVGQRIGQLNGSLLVVYRLGAGGASCIVGSIDGRARDANRRARDMADTYAPGFICGTSARH